MMTACERLLKELESRLREFKLANNEAGKPDATDKAKTKAEEAERVFIALRERIRPIIKESGTDQDQLVFMKWEKLRELRPVLI